MRLCILISALLLSAPASVVAEENLVKNPSFEAAPAANGKAGGGWWLYEAKGNPQFKLEGTTAHHGKASASIQATNDTKCTLVSAPFPIVPGDEIRFEAWVRGEHLPHGQTRTYAGLAFRQADGGVSKRSYFQSEPVGRSWSLISGVAEVPAGTVSAEVHLGYTNAPGTLWFDDISAVISNSLSFSLVESAKPWPGEQPLTLRLASRQTNLFLGSIRASVGKQSHSVPVSLEAGATREVQVPITLLGVGAHNYKLSLLDAAGAPVRVLEGKFQTSPPLVLFPARPCYHAAGEGSGETSIDARINLNPAQRTGMRLVVEVADASGKPVQTATADASQGVTVGATIRVPIRAPAAFTVTARLLDGAAKQLGTASTEVRVILPEQCRVQTGPDGFLRVAGKPQFTVGLYSCGRYEEMGQAGFSGTHNYQLSAGEADEAINPNEKEVQRLLDTSWANGMRMMVELPRKAIEKAKWQQIRRRIETFRHHPGLLCWGSEERVARGLAPLTNLSTLYRLVHELDPDHPLVLGDTKDVIQKFLQDRSDFFPDACMDAGIWWWYPIPLHAPDANGLDGREKPSGLLQPPSWLTGSLSKKPLWIAIQSYQQPRPDARFPTPEEYRCMAYLSIINGVKALWFYTGSGQKDWAGKPAGLLNRPEDGHWPYVKQLVTELREFSPVIMAPACAEKLTLFPADAPIEFATRELEGKLYLIAANKSDRTQAVRFSGSALKGKRVQVLYETHPVTLTAESLNDDFPAFGVHLYRLE